MNIARSFSVVMTLATLYACSERSLEGNTARQESDAELMAERIDLDLVERTVSLEDTGLDVRQVNLFLFRHGYFENRELALANPGWRPVVAAVLGQPDVFSSDTELALRAFQSRNGLADTGVVDAATRALMSSYSCGTPDGDADSVVEKWAHWTGQGFIDDSSITYNILAYPTTSGSPSAASVDAEVAAAFAIFTNATNLTATKQSGTVDITVTWRDIPDSEQASNVYGHTVPGAVPAVEMDTAFAWSVSPEAGKMHLRSAVAHELGHALGFEHSAIGDTSIMWPGLSTGVRHDTLSADDRNSIYASPYTSWRLQPGTAREVAVGANGAVWAIGTNAAGSDFQILRFNGSSWVAVAGAAKYIAVEPNGTPWVINGAGSIYRRAGVTGANPTGDSWTLQPGTATDIAVGSQGTVCVLGTGASADKPVFKWVSGSSTWSQVGTGAGKSIAVDSNGNPWVANSSNRVYRWLNNTWSEVPGNGFARDIAAGPNASIWVIGAGSVGASNFEIWSWNEQGATNTTPVLTQWVKTSGGATKIALGPNGQPWVVNSSNAIYRKAR